jgi:O-antigen ligase
MELGGIETNPAPARGSRPEDRPQSALAVRRGRRLLCLLWLCGLVPSTINLFVVGRSSGSLQHAAVTAPHAVVVGHALVALLVLTSIFYALTTPGRHPTRNLARLCAAVAPWCALQAATIVSGGTPSLVTAALPAVVLAIWAMQVPPETLALNGHIAAAISTGSVLMALVAPDLALMETAAGPDEKAIIGNQLLAGPYSHSNILGMALVLSLPSFLLVSGSRLRRAEVAVVFVALIWSSSRTSIVAGLLLLGLLIAFRLSRFDTASVTGRRHSAVIATTTACVIIPLLAALPLLTKELAAFSYRGAIWSACFHYWQQQKFLGYGPGFFRTIAPFDAEFGVGGFHGHNMFIQLLVTGGVVSVCLALALLLMLTSRALRALRLGEPYAVLWLLPFLLVCCLEVPTDLLSPSPLMSVVWAPAAIVLLVRWAGKPDEVRSRTTIGVRVATASATAR